MSLLKERHQVVIKKFEELLRSGKDYTVTHMTNEAGKTVYISGARAKKIIQKHYQEVITQDMIDFVEGLNCCYDEIVNKTSEKYGICRRESILIIRYIQRR